MKTLTTIGLVLLAAIAAWWIGGVVIGVVATVLHWAVMLAIFGGIVCLGFAIANPNKALGWRRRILP